MWSFNRDGQCDVGLERDRNEAMGVDRDSKRSARADLVNRARPQRGVALLDAAFPASAPIPGVVDQTAER